MLCGAVVEEEEFPLLGLIPSETYVGSALATAPWEQPRWSQEPSSPSLWLEEAWTA